MGIEGLDAGQNALLEEVMSLSPAVREVKLLSAAKAALMLDVSESTLEKRRKRFEPPPPAPNWAGGKKGQEVKYLASTLVEFITGAVISQPNPYPSIEVLPLARNAADLRRSGLGVVGVRRHLMKFGTTSVELDDAAWPFFLNQQGLVISPCWESIQATADSFLDDRIEVKWMGWVAALAGVWAEEVNRRRWLDIASEESPGLPVLVAEERRFKLSTL